MMEQGEDLVVEAGVAVQKVLIVDDNTLFRKVLRETLHSRLPSLIISEAKSQEEALGITGTFLPDLIFVDIRLPDGNGLELTRKIQRLYHGIKIVILTNYDESEYRNLAYRYKADHYISKDAFMSLLNVVFPEASPN